MTTVVTCVPEPADDRFAVIKARQQATWASGDFAVIGTTLQIVGEQLCEAVDVRAGERVLDVAAGNGNATLAAARRLAQVMSTDYVPTHCSSAGGAAPRRKACDVTFQCADAEALPFAGRQLRRRAVDVRRDVRARPPRARPARLLRVCRPGGRIGLASWTPGGFIGAAVPCRRARTSRRSGVPSPLLWGSDDHIETSSRGAAQVEHATRHFMFRYRSARAFRRRVPRRTTARCTRRSPRWTRKASPRSKRICWRC